MLSQRELDPPGPARRAPGLGLDVTIGSCPRLRRRELGLPCNAVVHHLAFDAPGVNVFSLTDAVRFRQLERARFTPFVPGELTRTRERLVVRGRKVWAPGDQSRTTQDYPSHVRVSRVICPKLECAPRCKRRPPAWRSAQRSRTESDRTVSRGASDVHWGAWIQAPSLLEPREVVRTAANVPLSMQCRRRIPRRICAAHSRASR